MPPPLLEVVADAGGGVAFDLGRVDQTEYDEAINRFDRINRVAACNRNAGIAAYVLAAAQDHAYGFERQHIDRHADQAERHDGRAAHRVHIADGVGGGNAAKVERIVDDGHEEVGGGDQRLLVVEQVHGRIIRGFYADQQFLRQGKAAAAL